uniref:4a-hydroxytetrahydrobiopterin dehydratase n=1 Tax=Romanomermis culicivorax TaxID=13658 RepID=A0A915J1G7_ROMCU
MDGYLQGYNTVCGQIPQWVQLTRNVGRQQKAEFMNFRNFTKIFELLAILKKNGCHPDPASYHTVGAPIH